MKPIVPMKLLAGSAARKPNRISEGALSPLVWKSRWDGSIISSKPATCCRSCVLMPHTSKSPKPGIRRKTTAGRFFFCPSVCGRSAKTMSPSFIVLRQRRNSPVHPRHKPWPDCPRPDVWLFSADSCSPPCGFSSFLRQFAARNQEKLRAQMLRGVG